MPEDLVNFLHARLDELEVVALSIPGPSWEHRQITTRQHDVIEDYVAVADPDRNTVILSDVDCAVLAYVLHHDPANAIADVEAKRRLIGNHRADDRGHCRTCAHWTSDWVDGHHVERLAYEGVRSPCLTLRLLALPYARHPEYQQHWSP